MNEYFHPYRPSIKSAKLLKEVAGAEGVFSLPAAVRAFSPDAEGAALRPYAGNVIELLHNVNKRGSLSNISPHSQKRVLNLFEKLSGENSNKFAGYLDTVKYSGAPRVSDPVYKKMRVWSNETGLPAIGLKKGLDKELVEEIVNHERIHAAHLPNAGHQFWKDHLPKKRLSNTIADSFLKSKTFNKTVADIDASQLFPRHRMEKIYEIEKNNPELYKKLVARADAMKATHLTYGHLLPRKTEADRLGYDSEQLAYTYQSDKTFLKRARQAGVRTHYDAIESLNKKVMKLGESSYKKVGIMSKIVTGARKMVRSL